MLRTKRTVARTLLSAAAIAIVAAVPANTTHADEFCVTCTGPFAMYRCAVDNGGVLTAPAGAQLPCIKQLARQGGHASCSVRREDRAAPECIGRLLVIQPDPALQIPPDHPINAEGPPIEAGPDNAPSGEGDTQTAATPEDPDAPPKPQGEPKTVEELAKRTVESTPENLKKAGEAVVDAAKSTGGHIKDAGDFVGSTAKKTWDCVASFFMKCGS